MKPTSIYPPVDASTLLVDAATADPEYRFLFRARVTGVFDWTCPACGVFYRARLQPASYTLQCLNARCRRVWGLGHVLHALPMTRRSIPDDYVIPTLREPLPVGDVGRWWRSGQLMHCVHTATGHLAMPPDSIIAGSPPPPVPTKPK